jgi:hypothetical protein
MKKVSSFILAAVILLAACNNNKPKTATITSDDGKEKVTFDADKMQNAAADMEKQKKELEKLPPLTIEQLKAMIPENLMGAKRTNFQASTSMGAGLATGEYQINDSTDVKLNIYDCAGTAGAGIYSLQYLGMMNIQQESDDEYTKTVDFNGGKAYEHCNKSSNECTITYFAGGRFLVTLEGNHVGADALKDAAKGLSIK